MIYVAEKEMSLILMDVRRLAKESSYSVDEFAKHLDVGTRALQFHCREYYNKTPRQLLSELKLVEVLRLARLGLPEKVIAESVGYRHASNFSRWFKQETGKSFRDYRTIRDQFGK